MSLDGVGGDEESRRAAVLRLEGGDEALGELVEALGDVSWRVRKEAAARAAAWTDPSRAALALVDALGEPDNVGRRNAAVEGLVRIGLPALGPLADALGRRPEHRKLLIDALGLIGDRRAAGPLSAALEDPDANVRAAAAEALGSIGGDEAEAALGKALDRGELVLSLACLDGLNRMSARLPAARIIPLIATPVLRSAALEALGRSDDAGAIPSLIGALPSRSRSTREAAASAIERLHHGLIRAGDKAGVHSLESALHALRGDAERMLVEALLEGTPSARRSAAALLGWAKRPMAARALALALGDPAVAEAASDALALIGAPARPTLCTLAMEFDAPLRAAIFSLLPRLGARPEDAVEEAHLQSILVGALGDQDGEVAAAAAGALGELGGSVALEPLVAALAGVSRVAITACQALIRLADRYADEIRPLVVARGLGHSDGPLVCRVLGALARIEDTPLLMAALRADSPAVRRAAAEALAVHGGLEVEEALCFALADEVSEVRAGAARALGARSAARSVAALAAACGDADTSVRTAAARALGAIGGTAALDALRILLRSSDGVTAVHALEALGRAGEPGDEALLVDALGHEDIEVAKAAARALAAVAGDAGLFGLGRALDHPRWDVRRVAALSLGERGGTTAVTLLRTRLAVEDDELVREALTVACDRAAGRSEPV